MSTRKHLTTLLGKGAHIVEPTEGPLASGAVGAGRMAEPDVVFEAAAALLTDKTLRGERIVITAGPTREAFDPVRFLSNPSTGKMGYALAKVARRRGADVLLISGPTHLPAPSGVEMAQVTTTQEMLEACQNNLAGASALLMAAAPADFRPRDFSPWKIKKDDEKNIDGVALERTPDILLSIAALRQGCFVVGFAAESHELTANARAKLANKQLDMVVANNIAREDSGFASDNNAVTIIDRAGQEVALPLMSKERVAEQILDRVQHHLKNKQSAPPSA